MIKWLLTKIVGTKNQREVKRLKPIVEQIVSIEESWSDKGQEFLVEKTKEWQAYLHRFLPMDLPPVRIVEAADQEALEGYAEMLNTRFDSLRKEFAALPKVEATATSVEEGKAAWHNIEPQFEKLRERYLNQILPEAFAVVKHGARLLCGTERNICGQPLTWEMIHFDVQLIGGIALHRGYIAEMATGEGKTLVATLPVYLNALTGLGVHVVTVNDYLARRDSEWMGMLFQYLGLTVGCIQSMMPSQIRREQYACDITYGTNAEFGFDYLRDNGMATSRSEQVQRGHYFSIVDEVDSILIDEARTPLIISGPAVITREQQYDALCPAIERVVKAQTDLCNELMAQGRKAFEAGNIDLAGRCLYKVKLGQPRHRDFMRAMQEPELRRIVEKYELTLYQDTRKRELYKLKEELFFSVDEKTHDADLMEKGREVISPGHPEVFVLPDLGTIFAEMEENPRLTEQDKQRRKHELTKQLEETSARLHTTSQLLKAYCIYEKDVEYIVRDGKVIIIDQNTGREMPGRRWSDGLHQAVEAKEGVEVERENQTYATITIQNYFRLYKKLAGMTGTAETEAAEFHDIYKLDVLPIPTNRPCIREDQNDLIFKSRREKLNAVVNKIKELHANGQPVLIGTASVEASQTLSRMLKNAKIPHEVLNAKNHQREAEIVALAGKRGAVTVSTNMAGRGTDIKLGEGVADLGGLFVLGTERHESRRIDRQLRGRCSRQGDPGASQFFISFEDDLMRNFAAAERMTRMMERLGVADGEALEHSFLNKSVESAQKRVEQRNYMWRKHVLDYDDVMNKQREIVYGYRNEVLSTENPRDMIYDVLEEVIAGRAHEHLEHDAEGQTHPELLLSWLNSTFPLGLKAEEAKLEERSLEDTVSFLIEKVKGIYEDKASRERAEYLDHMERQIILSAIDKMWQEHLYNMDSLREGVRLRAQGQKDPLVEYKSEAYELFISLMDNIKNETIGNLFKSTTNLDAFEDFLAGLPQFDADEDNAEGNLPEIGFDGMPSDLLSALREQISRVRNQQQSAQAAQNEQEYAHAPEGSASIGEGTTLPENYKPAKPEPKLVMPKRKVSVVLRKEAPIIIPAGEPLPNGEVAQTLDSQDFAETMDNRESAGTKTY